MFMISEEKGCATQIFCATNKTLKEISGCYYENSIQSYPWGVSKDNGETDQLYQKSKELVARYL
jgi:hypothetical protein